MSHCVYKSVADTAAHSDALQTGATAVSDTPAATGAFANMQSATAQAMLPADSSDKTRMPAIPLPLQCSWTVTTSMHTLLLLSCSPHGRTRQWVSKHQHLLLQLLPAQPALQCRSPSLLRPLLALPTASGLQHLPLLALSLLRHQLRRWPIRNHLLLLSLPLAHQHLLKPARYICNPRSHKTRQQLMYSCLLVCDILYTEALGT